MSELNKLNKLNQLNQLEYLKKITTVVADTGEIEAIVKFKPQDATTNPSLLLKAADIPAYQSYLLEAIEYAKSFNFKTQAETLARAVEKFSVTIGAEILKIIPGRVSTEVDARFSFDVNKTVEIARRVIKLYDAMGVSKERVLIKIASTWEGIKACEILEQEGIHCNMTLIFDFNQAIACADAKATLISPFVGRIYDWYKNKEQREFDQTNDPGVLFVQKIFNYFRFFNIPTIVMGASFRNIGQIQGLAGCDYLTISPNLLALLEKTNEPLDAVLSLEEAKQIPQEKIVLDESRFRFLLNENAMATEKLAEGIRLFCQDIKKLETKLAGSY